MKALANLAVSAAWSSVNWAGRAAYRSGWLPARRLEGARRVLSVGNLQAGGSGKTPIVAWLARAAIERGYRVAILTRGYGGRWASGGGGVIRPDSRPEELPSSLDAGDEALLLRDLVPGVWIGIGGDRRESFARVREIAKQDFDWVILDDAFQHWRIQRDVDIVAVTSASRTMVPYRDFDRALALSPPPIVVWTKGETRHPGWGSAIVRVRFTLDGAALSGRDIFLVTGVGDPDAVAHEVLRAGARLVAHRALSDHAVYSLEACRGFLAEAKRAGARLAVTGKDWVKWRELGIDRAEVEVLEPRLEILEGGELWTRALWGS